jgi:hypothetical protein
MATAPLSGRDTLRLKPAKAPRLPIAAPEYDPNVVNSSNNILRQYFNEVDNNVGALLGPEGARFISAPYGSFYDTTTQTAVASTATVITLNSTDVARETSIASGSNITVTYPGIYNMQFSVQLENSAASVDDVSIWIRQFNRDGTQYFSPSGDLPGSNGTITVPAKHGATSGAIISGWNYFLTMQGGDYIQLMWSTPAATTTIVYHAAQTGPVRPGTSSVVLTMTFVSSLPT